MIRVLQSGGILALATHGTDHYHKGIEARFLASTMGHSLDGSLSMLNKSFLCCITSLAHYCFEVINDGSRYIHLSRHET